MLSAKPLEDLKKTNIEEKKYDELNAYLTSKEILIDESINLLLHDIEPTEKDLIANFKEIEEHLNINTVKKLLKNSQHLRNFTHVILPFKTEFGKFHLEFTMSGDGKFLKF